MKAHLSPVTLGAALVLTLAGCSAGDSSNTFPTDFRELSGKKEKDCTYTQGYWKNHVSKWPGNTASIVGCGQTWPENLETPPAGDAFYILSHQWIAATLNRSHGAETTPEIDDALLEGGAILFDCEVTDDEHDDAIAIAELLDAYNSGDIGPGHCGD